jgi:hypothetical protein
MLLEYEWNNSISDINILSHKLTTCLSETLNYLCPMKVNKIPLKHEQNKWINSEIIELMKKRDEKYKVATISKNEELWEEYRKLRNNVLKKIRTAKNQYFFEMIDENRSNPRKMWKNLNKLLPNKKEKYQEEIIFPQGTIRCALTIAENFNGYFVKSIQDIVENIKMNNDTDFEQDVFQDNRNTFSTFRTLDMPTFKKIVRSLKNTAGGENGITTKILRDAVEVIANRFLDVINNSLQEGKFPEKWKTSIVPKIPKTRKCDEFRPINIVPVYEKILKVAVKNQLIEFCDKNLVINSDQSGFREKHSCEALLLEICDNWVCDIENKQTVLAVFLDLKRAFETVDRKILIKKMKEIGVNGTVLEWFTSYLTNRKQKVKYCDNFSKSILVENGVPQGTVLGPVLFIIYINDIIKHVKHCKIKLFADDTMIYVSGRDVCDMMNKINEDLNNIYKYLCNHKLSVNENKCKFIIIKNEYNVSGDNVNIEINNVKLERVQQIKYLGVIIDSKLKFHSYAPYLQNKMSKKAFFLSRISKNLSSYTKLVLYKSLITPHIDYCSSLLYMLPNYRIKELQIIQNRCMRIILKCDRYTSVQYMLNILQLMDVKTRIIYNTLVTIYKIKNKLMPNYLLNKVTYNSNLHRYSLRNNNMFKIDICRTNRKFNTLFYKGLSTFNMLPWPIKECTNVNRFRKELIRSLVESCGHSCRFPYGF